MTSPPGSHRPVEGRLHLRPPRRQLQQRPRSAGRATMRSIAGCICGHGTCSLLSRVTCQPAGRFFCIAQSADRSGKNGSYRRYCMPRIEAVACQPSSTGKGASWPLSRGGQVGPDQ